jgi:hypothetical protein
MDFRKRLEIGLIVILGMAGMAATFLTHSPRPSLVGKIVSISTNLSGRGLIHKTTAIVELGDGRKILAVLPKKAKTCQIGQSVELSNEGMRTLINSDSCDFK